MLPQAVGRTSSWPFGVTDVHRWPSWSYGMGATDVWRLRGQSALFPAIADSAAVAASLGDSDVPEKGSAIPSDGGQWERVPSTAFPFHMFAFF